MAEERVLTRGVRAQIEAFLAGAYPAEGCGIVCVTAAGEPVVYVSENRAEAARAENPELYTRGAENGYVLDGRLIVRAERAGETLAVIFHSHPDVGAYFSEEDARKALVDWGDGPEPAYPDVDYLVTAVNSGEAVESVLFRYTSGAGPSAFAEVVRYPAAA